MTVTIWPTDQAKNQSTQRKRAAIYVRRSHQSEGRSKSITEQLAECHMVCRAFDLEITEENTFCEGEGMKGDWWWAGSHMPGPYRPVLGELITALKSGAFDVLVVWRTDRLYRDAGIADAILKAMRERGIGLIANRHDCNIHTAAGFANASQEAVRNREYRDKLSEDIRRDKEFKAGAGRIICTPLGFGFRSAGNGTAAAVTVPTEIAIVRRIFNMYVIGEDGSGPMTMWPIAKKLMSEGYEFPILKGPFKGRTRDRYNQKDIGRILRCKKYISVATFRGQDYDTDAFLVPAEDGSGKMETVVPRAIWDKAQMKQNNATKADSREDQFHLLTGLTACHICGGALYPQGTKNVPFYFGCTFRQLHKGISSRTLAEVKMDAWVKECLAPLLLEELKSLRELRNANPYLDLRADVMRKLEAVRERETATLLSKMDVLDACQFRQLADHLRRERQTLQDRVDELNAMIKSVKLPDLDIDDVAQLATAELRAALQQTIEYIVIGNKGVFALTKWGTYIAAPYRKGERTRGEDPRSLQIGATRITDALSCRELLQDPAAFLAGRRRLRRCRDMTADQLIPGMLDQGEVTLAEIEVSDELITELKD